MHRTLYVLVYPSRLFAAHWSFWLPYVDAENRESNAGDRIHVTGDRLNGFEYEYIRDYDVYEDDRHPNAFPIGRVSATCLSDRRQGEVVTTANGDQDDADKVALSAFDEACREVPAPGPSLNKVNSGTANRAPHKRAEVKDCQWWIREATSHLAETGILSPLQEGESPSSTVNGLPCH
ncbi:hypothetical protein GGR52DRAFT_101768 [Hypoxylon sp. FL1284]|nr:hypothetical protein GGR52DRAFT_101768 [Hypoxylon sp. FL1284]